MAQLTVSEIQKPAKSIVASNPGGIRFTALANQILRQHPGTNENRVYNAVSLLVERFPNEVAKPSRGLFTPATKTESVAVPIGSTEEVTSTGAKVKESDFYQPFADWLKNDLEEVTEVAALGGAGLQGKWGTPDVVGTYKKQPGNVIEFPGGISGRIERYHEGGASRWVPRF